MTSGESAVFHHIQTNLLSYGDNAEMGHYNSAVAKTVKELTVAGSDD